MRELQMNVAKSQQTHGDKDVVEGDEADDDEQNAALEQQGACKRCKGKDECEGKDKCYG